MQRKNVKLNYIFNAAYQVLLLVTPLLTAPYLSRVLEPDGVGTASYVESIVAYFTLFATMGISTYGQREISYVQDDMEKRSLVFWNTKVLGFCTSAAATLVYVAFALLQKERSALYLILTLNLVAVFFDITWFFQGLEEFGKTVTRNAAFKILQIAYIFLFVKTKEDLPLYVLGVGLFTALGNLSLWAYLPRYIKRIDFRQLHPFRDIRVVWSLFIPTIAVQIYTVLDKTMIGVITDSSFENGYYEQAIKISRMLLSLVTALGTVMVPRVGNLFGKDEIGEVRRLMYRSYRFVWFLGIPLCFGVIMAAGNFVPWFFGPGYDKVVPLLQVLSFLILAIGINNVTGVQYFIPTKRQNLFTLTVIIGACTNFTLNMVLIRYYQSIGAAVASVAAETIIAVVQLVIVRKELLPRKVLSEGIHYYIAGGVMVLVLWPICRRLSPSILHTAMIVACGAATYFLILLVERDEFFLSNVKNILRRLHLCR